MATLREKLLSSFLLVGEAISKKLIGLISTLVLARVLVPEDFGLVAIAILILNFLEVFANTGSQSYILRAETVDKRDLDTAWSIDLSIRLALAVVFVISAPYITNYYDDPRLYNLLCVFASMMVVEGLANPGLNLLKRNQDYVQIVKLSIGTKVVSVTTAVSIALIYESYWALVLGQYVNSLVMVVGGYFIYPYKPSLNFSKFKEQWAFSSWVIPQSILGFARAQLDTLIVSAVYGKDQLGSYHVMKYLAYLPSANLILPATQPLLVELSTIRDNRHYFATQFNVTLLLTMCMALPVAFYLAIFSPIVIEVALGTQWVEYAPLFSSLAILIPSFAAFQHANRTFYVFNETKYTTIFELASVLVIYSSLFYLVNQGHNIIAFVDTKVVIESCLTLAYLFYASNKYNGVRASLKLLLHLVPVLLSCLLAGYLSLLFMEYSAYPIVNLVLTATAFFVAFGGAIAIFHLLFFQLSEEWRSVHRFVLKVWLPLKKSVRRQDTF